jgi:hypothetical protein
MPITYTVTVYNDRIEWKNEAREFHREDGPAIEYAKGNKFWYLNGKRHREDGPAIEWSNGDKSWFINGMRHREDGPAVEHVNGYKAWWLNGIQLTEEEYNKRINQSKPISCNGKIVEIDGKRYKLNEI